MKIHHVVLAGAALAFSVSAVHATTWRMATPYPDSNFHTQNINLFAEEVEKESGGKLKINVHPAGSLVKHQEIKNAIRSNQIEIGEFIISGLANENPIFALDSVPFVAVSYDESKKMYEVSKPYLEDLLGKQNVQLLYSVAWPPQGLYTDRPIETAEDLKGLKMRAYSPQTERLAQLAGAVPTQVEVPDLPQAFSTGRVNAMITSTSTGVNASAWDFLTHFYDVAAFLPKNVVAVNKRSFDALDPETQKVVLQAAANAEKRGWEMSEKDHGVQRRKLEENGIEVSNGSDALNASLHEYGKTMAAEWGKEAGAQGQEILEIYLK